MGIPRFFRWISERYPCITQQITDQDMLEFDNLFIDMNGIIHTCSHGDENLIISEPDIFEKVQNYIEFLFLFVNPQKLLFLAVDGVAPRAKMNQQRGRRFKAAKERDEQLRYALKKKEDLEPFTRFDSNCITPGTEFMANLEKSILEFLSRKVSADPLWQSVEVIFSGHLTPGEGEHKIMDYIRHARSSVDYNPNTRHCLYGLDADLIVLALSTHEPYITLLREEVKFNRGKQNIPGVGRPDSIHFNLLHITLLRDYIDLEFESLKTSETLNYDLYRVLDDWILLTFFIGNDFLPPIPNFSIANDAFSILWNSYKKLFSLHGGYLSEKGLIDKAALRKFFQLLFEFDQIIYDINHSHRRRKFRNKSGSSRSNNVEMSANNENDNTPEMEEKEDPLQPVETIELAECPAEASDCPVIIVEEELAADSPCGMDTEITSADTYHPLTQEEKYSKYRFYYYQLKVEVEESALTSLIRDYIHTLEWVLHYYVCGSPSWAWYYPHHYAPMLQDLSTFFPNDLSPHYSHACDNSSPLKPLEQLMAVLPPQSFTFLPCVYQSLVISDKSPLYDYYPTRFKIDRSLGCAKWDCIAILPFIDSTHLLSCLCELEDQLTSEEKERNVFMPSVHLKHVPENLSDSVSTQLCALTLLPADQFVLKREMLVLGRHPRFCETFHWGYPTLAVKKFEWSLEMCQTKVFETTNACESLILNVKDGEFENLECNAETCLGKIVLAQWPWHSVIRVTGVTDGHVSYHCQVPTETNLNEVEPLSTDQIIRKTLDEKSSPQILQTRDELVKHSLTRCGVKSSSSDTREPTEHGGPSSSLIVFGKSLLGHKWVPQHEDQSGRITRLVQIWSPTEQTYLMDRLSFPRTEDLFSNYLQLESLHSHTREVFALHSRVYLLDEEHYGQSATIIQSLPDLKLFVADREEQIDLSNKELTNDTERFISAEEIATRCNLTPTFVQLITGHLYLHRHNSKRNIGLCLKWYMGGGEEIEGWSKRMKDSDEGNYGGPLAREDLWLYSPDIIPILQQYREKFPVIWEAIEVGSEQTPPCLDYNEEDVFGKKAGGVIKNLTSFLHNLPSYSSNKRMWGTEQVTEQSLERIESILLNSEKCHIPGFELTSVDPQYLYNCWNVIGRVDVDLCAANWQLLDLVLKVSASFSVVNEGSHGYVIGIHTQHKNNNPKDGFLYSYKVLFESPFEGGTPLKPGSRLQWIMLPSYALINISHNHRQRQSKSIV